MKLVLFINSLAAGGAERVLSNLANHWCDEHEVVLVTLAELAEDVYPLDDRVRRVSLQAGQVSRSIIDALGNNLTRFLRLRRLVKNERPDCVVSFMTTANVLAIAATAGTRTPVIGSERVYVPEAGLPRSREILQRLTYRFASTIVAQTEDNGRWIRTNLRCSTTVIPNSIGLPMPRGDHPQCPEAFIQPDEKVVLCVGRIAAQKQLDHAIAAFAEVRLPAWRLVLLGRGPEADAIEAEIDIRNLQEHVTRIDHAGNVQDWYERADIYLLPSGYEGFPNTLLEAMACGCACIAYDCPTGPSDLIDDGSNGCLVARNDQERLAERLRALMQDDDLRGRLGTAARTVTDRFGEAGVFAKWTTVVTEALTPG